MGYTQGTSYAMAQSMLESLLGVGSDCRPTERAAQLRTVLARLLPGREAEYYPYLARLAGLALSTDEERIFHEVLPEAVRSRMQLAFCELTRAMCSAQPMVMVWEDIHWADPSSLGLVHALLSLVNDVPLLVLLVFRRNESTVEDWLRTLGDEGTLEIMELTPLTDEESELLVRNLLSIENLPDETRQVILEKAEGNPFFLEELLRSLVDSGAIVVEGTRVMATASIAQAEMPDSLQAVVAARIDALPADHKYVLQVAAVIGRVFQRSVLAHVLEQECRGERLEVRLADLEGRALIRSRQDNPDCIFKHAVTHDVTYSGLLLSRRRMLHRMTAEAIEALFASHVGDFSASLAHHYRQADVPDKALDYSLAASEQARSTYSNAEAIGYYQAALEQAQRCAPERAPDIYEGMGELLTRMGRGDEARDAFGQALSTLEPKAGIERARLHRKRGNSWMVAREMQNAVSCFFGAVEALGPEPLADNASWREAWLDIHLDICWAYYWSDRTEELEELIETMRPLVAESGNLTHRVRFLDSLVLLAWRRERYVTSDQTLAYARETVELSEGKGVQAQDITMRSVRRILLGMCHLWRNELEEAEENLEAGAKEAERIGSLEDQVLALTYLAATHRRLHAPQKVRELAAQTLELARGKMSFYVGSAQANLCWVNWAEGDAKAAVENGRAAFASWGPVPNPMVWMASWPLLALALSEGRIEDALGQARLLVEPPTVRLPAVLENALRDALSTGDVDRSDRAMRLLTQSVSLAQETGWL